MTSLDPSVAALERAQSLIAKIPDFPEPGILFEDLSPLFVDGPALRAVTEALVKPFEGAFDVVAGVEARGFILAGSIASMANVGTLLIRKAGKLPAPAARVDYSLEYGTASIEAPSGLPEGARVLIVDDVLATGGTLAAAHDLVSQLGGTVAGTAVVLEIAALEGHKKTGPVHTVFTS